MSEFEYFKLLILFFKVYVLFQRFTISLRKLLSFGKDNENEIESLNHHSMFMPPLFFSYQHPFPLGDHLCEHYFWETVMYIHLF